MRKIRAKMEARVTKDVLNTLITVVIAVRDLLETGVKE